jgi:hypothetical protein
MDSPEGIRVKDKEKFPAVKGRDQELRGVAKMANDRSILGTVVMDVLLSFNLVTILC